MMVPSAYLNRSTPSGLRDPQNEKEKPSNTSRLYKNHQPPKHQATTSRTSIPASPDGPSTSTSSPVQIPHGSQSARTSSSPLIGSVSHAKSRARDITQVDRTQSASPAPLESLLSSTAIPPRRRPQGRKSQKLPKGDHVADFSKLLLDDVAGADVRTAIGSFGNPQFEELFGQSADKDSVWRNAGEPHEAATPLSLRSMSSDSMPSLVVDDELAERSLSDLLSPPASVQKVSPDRRVRLLSTSEDCGDDHPLQHLNLLDPLFPMQVETVDLPMPPKSSPNQKSRTSSIRSNLTASLRALKSVAHTVSSLATTPPTTIPDDFLTRSIFSFAPELTDDKRPPPSDGPPSPALRRYLNPHPAKPESRSPTELHSYHEYPNPPNSKSPKKKSTKSPFLPHTTKSIQLQTCIPSTVRSSNASSPPIWLSPDGSPPSTSPADLSSFTGPNLARQREPRENAAFLRILVAEMNMRRSGKFDDAMDSHASVWLPPRKSVDGQVVRIGSERWAVYCAA